MTVPARRLAVTMVRAAIERRAGRAGRVTLERKLLSTKAHDGAAAAGRSMRRDSLAAVRHGIVAKLACSAEAACVRNRKIQ
jgi:hypothetical protein